MSSAIHGDKRCQPIHLLQAVACTVALLLAAGCPVVPGGDDNNNGDNGTNGNGSDGPITAEIVNVSRTIQISELEVPLSILYSVDASELADITSFFVPVGGGDADRANITTTSPLVPGSGQFPFDPSQTGVGAFRVGLVVVDGDETVTVISDGLIQVEGRPSPVFIQPVDAIHIVRADEDVAIRFDAGDPEGIVRWRVFYLAEGDSRAGPVDQLGTQIGPPGSGNVGSRVLATTGLGAADYQIGLSATDTGDSISTAVERGDSDRIVTVFGPTVRILSDDAALPPTVTILAPSSADVELFRDQSFTIELSAEVFDPGGGQVEVFYDTDRDIGNGFAATIGAAAISASSGNDGAPPLTFLLPTTLAEGTYHIGASISDSINATVTTYALGSITVIRIPTLVVTAPDLNLPVAPSDPEGAAADVAVAWTTNVPPFAGTVDVFARKVNLDGVQIGTEIEILAPNSATVTNALFNPVESGVYEITVRLTLSDPTVNVVGLCTDGTCLGIAPQPVRVTTLPQVMWLGSLVQASPAFEGALFIGMNEEDNLGSDVGTAGDLDSDDLSDFMIAARYGKSSSGGSSPVGPGAAYVVYGASGASKLEGVNDVSAVGGSFLRGVVVFGVETVGNTDATDGLAAMAVIPDVDGDGKGELAFGFPSVNSACSEGAHLCNTGQFQNGGVVIVSSDNTILGDPNAGNARISCNRVGQFFSEMSVADSATLVVSDRFRFDDGTNVCISGFDQVDDTVIGPAEGFISLFASPANGGFLTLPPGTPPAVGICPTQYSVPTCVDAAGSLVFGGDEVGSGFYPAGTIALEPKGARIIGQSVGDGFGASISTTPNPAEGPRGEVIITAPNRHAQADEVDGISLDINNSGIAFVAANRKLWGTDDVGNAPPTPHQYSIGMSSFCGQGRTAPFDPLRIVGDNLDNIRNVLGIRDFNTDGRADIAVGVPTSSGGEGRVYIVYRSSFNNADVVLGNLESPAGAMITSNTVAGLGASLATDIDFNGDGTSDLVIGSPNAGSGIGEVIVVFGSPDLVSPPGGISVDTLLAIRGPTGLARAARITGSTTGGEQTLFGFNVANAGDVDGDGFNDLLIAAPNASPRFDDNPTDTVDQLTALGVDLDFDGVKDDVSGPAGFPDGEIDDFDSLETAGIVYVVFGGNRLDQILASDLTISIDELGSDELRGLMITGRAAGDQLGGGDAGDTAAGGIVEKRGRGRSHGLGSAGDVDGDGRADLLIGAVLADPFGVKNAGEAYLIHGSAIR